MEKTEKTVKIEVKVAYKIKLPSVPNFMSFEKPPARWQDGWKADSGIDVAELSDETLREVGAQWTEALLENARKRRFDALNVCEPSYCAEKPR